MIYIKRGSRKLSFEGTSQYTPSKFKHQTRQYLTGETFSSYRAKVNTLSVNIVDLSDDDYNTLELMVFDKSIATKYEIITEDDRNLYMSLLDSNIPLTNRKNDKKENVWSGTLQFSE